MQEHGTQRGFILVASLLVLALAGAIMAAIARGSGNLALRANTARERLRVRWGMVSLQRAFLPRVERILSAAEAKSSRPQTWARRRIRLSGMGWELTFGDEQARANVNVLYARRGRIGLTVALEKLLRQADAELTVALRPLESAPGRKERVREPFRCFGQMFLEDDPEQLLRPFAQGPPPVSGLTCWGDGRLNFRRASALALGEVTSGVLTAYQRGELIDLRARIPGISLAEALPRLGLTKQQRTEVAALLTDRSTCYSLWIVARTADRRFHRLAVSGAAGASGGADAATFEW